MAEFTYEDIYELLRMEKYSTDLQLVKLEDLRKVKEYFEAKRGLLAKQTKDSEFYDKAKKDKLKTELENARRALKDWYEKREKKLLSRATFTARTDFKLRDTTNMLPSEEKVYLRLLDVLKENYSGFFSNFKKGAVDVAADVPAEAPATTPELAVAQAAPQIILKKIRVRQQIPELMGPDLQTYGPFNENDVAAVPEDIAALLIGQGKAEDVVEGGQAAAIEVRVGEDVKAIEQATGAQ
jgi:DNA replication initiation complex subunit (GINS family)